MELKKIFSKKEKKDQFTPDLLTPEKIKTPLDGVKQELEKHKEKTAEGPLKNGRLEVESAEKDAFTPIPSTTAPTPAPAVKSINLRKIENIMQEDLEEVYFKMDEAHRRLLKQEGERVAHQIEQIVVAGKSVAVKVLELIKKWLTLIPGVNKFFVEQEAKIKTDKILKINQQKQA